MENAGNKENTILSFKGPISIHVRTFFGNFMKVVVDQDYKTVNKLFKTFIELTQNVAFYSAEKLKIESTEVGVGEFKLIEADTHFIFHTENKIFPAHGVILKTYCDEINGLDIMALRELKREKRRQSPAKDVGAHIGLIHVGIITESKLLFNIKEIDEKFSYFNIGVQIEKY